MFAAVKSFVNTIRQDSASTEKDVETNMSMKLVLKEGAINQDLSHGEILAG